MGNELVFSIFVIFFGASIVATLALLSKQSLLVGYIFLGLVVGPSGLSLVTNHHIIEQVGDFGIIFLLFLLGLNLQPQNLIHLLKKTTIATVTSSIIFALAGALVAMLAGFEQTESLIIGACMMFSSTILGLKLLPTTVLHHQKSGEIVVSVLLLQDIIAIFCMLLINQVGTGSEQLGLHLLYAVGSLPLLIGFAYLISRYVLIALLKKFSRIHEYIFLLAIGWCLTLGQLAEWLNVSYEVGAFIAGITLATSPISRFIAECLRPLRDFFLILFFFAMGAGLDLAVAQTVIVPAIIMTGVMLVLKPLVFSFLLKPMNHLKALRWELGVRLGQVSEFSLLVGYVALNYNLISFEASLLVQLCVVFSFIVSSYYIVGRYPTPIALSDKLRRD